MEFDYIHGTYSVQLRLYLGLLQIQVLLVLQHSSDKSLFTPSQGREG